MASSRSSSPAPGRWTRRSTPASSRSISPERAPSAPAPLGSLLDAVLADLGIARRLAETRAMMAWDEVVGAPLAHQARPVRVLRGRLEVAVSSAAWRTHLSFVQKEIVGRLNEAAGEAVITELTLVNKR